jgi:hypothetical protein
MDLKSRSQRLVEATTVDAIDFIPVHLGMVRTKIKDLAREKAEWGIEVLEGDESNVLQIEDRLRINVPKKHWNDFLTIFDGTLKDADYLNLSTVLKESKESKVDISEVIEDEMKDLRKRLKPALTEMFNEEQFRAVDKAANIWKSWFKVDGHKTRSNKGPVVSCERKGKDIQKLYGKLLREYGEDKGNLEMLLEDIDNNRPLNAYDVFKDRDFLYGTRILSRQDRISLIFEAVIDVSFDSSQSIYIEDEEILANVQEQVRTVKRVGNVIYPVGGQFSPSFFRVLKDIVEDVAGGTEE